MAEPVDDQYDPSDDDVDAGVGETMAEPIDGEVAEGGDECADPVEAGEEPLLSPLETWWATPHTEQLDPPPADEEQWYADPGDNYEEGEEEVP